MADSDSLWENSKKHLTVEAVYVGVCTQCTGDFRVSEEDFCLGVFRDIARHSARVWRLGFISGSACN